MKKVCIIGHFAEGKNLLNGQTVKTKIIYKELVKQLGISEVDTIDTYGGVMALIKQLGKYFQVFANCHSIIMLPAENGLRVLTPIFCMINILFRRKIYYVVIGGWLPNFISDKPLLNKMLKSFKGIYVETYAMKNFMEDMNFSNVTVMYNCKDFNINKNILECSYKTPFRICTFSRVMKEKGIEDAINAVKMVNKKFNKKLYVLDIFGQIDENQKNWFASLKDTFPTEVRYAGVVPFDKSTEVLKDYFAVLFPTYYEGEGFAGTLIDSFAAGVPVIATDWKYNSEIVDDDTGILFETRNVSRLVDILAEISEKPEKFALKRVNCIAKANNFLPQNALQVLINEVK